MFRKTKLTLAVASLLCAVGLSAQTDDNYQYDEPGSDYIAITVADQPAEPVQVAPPPVERDTVDTLRVRRMNGRSDVIIHGSSYIGGCDVGLRKVGSRLYCPPDNPSGGRTPPGYRWDPAAFDPAQSRKPGAFVLIPPPPSGGGGGGGGGGSGGSGGMGEGGYRGSDGNLYSSRDAVPGQDFPCSCSHEVGQTAEATGTNPDLSTGYGTPSDSFGGYMSDSYSDGSDSW